MKLSNKQVSSLIDLVVSAKRDDLGCDGCLELIDQFAQAELDGTEIPEIMKKVRDHLEQCLCCRDEYDALLIALRAIR